MTFARHKFLKLLLSATVVILAEYVLVLSDSVISGRLLGETALGAMNLLMPVFATISFFTMMLGVGTSIVYGEAIGRQDREGAARLAGQGLLAALLLGLVLVVAALVLESPYLSFMGVDGETLEFSGAYWKWYPAIVLLEAVDLVLLYLVYVDGGELCCTVSYTTQVVVNIAASYWLCRQRGMEGISLGTVIAYAVGILFLTVRILSQRERTLRFRLCLMPRELLRSCQAAFGDASTVLFQALLFLTVNKYVIFNWGVELLPITAVVFCVVRLTLFFNGIGIALQPIETVYHGEGNATGVERIVRFAAACSFVEGLAVSCVVFIAPELIVSLVGIADVDLVAAARRAVRLSVIGLSGYALAYLFISHYQYVGRAWRSVVIAGLAFFVMPVAILGLDWFARSMLGLNYGDADGVWIALAAGPACALAAYLPFVWNRDGNEEKPRPLMWSVKLSRAGALERRGREIKKLLYRRYGERMAQRIVSLILQAGQRVRVHNEGRRVRAEITVKDEGDSLTVILRDDGEILALEGLSVKSTAVPAAGFNRNVFVFPKEEVAES